MGDLLLVACGGAAGCVARFLISKELLHRFGSGFPAGTFLVNLSGAFLIGLAMALLARYFGGDPKLRLTLVTGFLGGYTTFSAYEWEAFGLVRDGQAPLAVLYLLASVVLGYIAVVAGSALGNRL